MGIRRFKTSLFSQGKQYGVLSGRVTSIPTASGGIITYAGGYTIHTFTTTGSNTFTINNNLSPVEYLIVAGGGGTGMGSENPSGGGGAGGLISGNTSNPILGLFTVIVGSAGLGGARDGTQGGSSSFYGVSTTGGGYGGNWAGNGCSARRGGGSGGSGGGGVMYGDASTSLGGSGIAGQGNNGGNGVVSSATRGGGGGAGSAGSGNSSGSGLSSSISGSSVLYSIGGGSTSNTSYGSGSTWSNGTDAVQGVVIIRYLSQSINFD